MDEQDRSDKRIYAAYCRVSTHEQAESGVGLDAQKDALIKWARANDGRLAWFVDDITTRVPFHERPEGEKLMRAVRAKKVAGVLFTKLDRGWRSLKDAMGNIDEWVKAGAEVRILNFQNAAAISESDKMGRLMLQIFASFAEYERDMTSLRTREGLAHISRTIDRVGEYKSKKSGRTIKTLGPGVNDEGVAYLDLARQKMAEVSMDARVARAQELAPAFLAAFETLRKRRPDVLYVNGKLNVDLVLHWLRQDSKLVVPIVRRSGNPLAFFKNGRHVQSARDVSSATMRRIFTDAVENGFFPATLLVEDK